MIELDLMALWDATTPEAKVAEIFRQCPDLALPVPIRELASRSGILAIISFDEAFPQLNGEFPVDGMIVSDQFKEKGVIFYKDYTNAPGRSNFTIAHELGHHLHPCHGTSQSCTGKDFAKTNRDSKQDKHETEANIFARKLLLPDHLISPLLDSRVPSLELFKEISALSGASFRLTANTCSTLMSSIPMVLIYSKNSRCESIWTNQKVLRDSLKIKPGGVLPGSLGAMCLDAVSRSFSESSACSRDAWFCCGEELSLPLDWVEQIHFQRNGYAVTLIFASPYTDQLHLDN